MIILSMKSGYEGGGFGRSCHPNQEGSAGSDPADPPIQTMTDPDEDPLHPACHDHNRVAFATEHRQRQ